jgi:hypothetical protein
VTRRLLLILALLLPAGAPAAAQEVWQKGQWLVRDYPDPRSPAAGYCAAGIENFDGNTLIVTIHRSDRWQIKVAREGWLFVKDTSHRLILSVGNTPMATLQARVTAPDELTALLPDPAWLMEAVREGRDLRAVVDGAHLTLSLAGALDPMARLLDCASQAAAREGIRPGPPASAAPRPPAPSANPFVAPPATPGAAASSPGTLPIDPDQLADKLAGPPPGGAWSPATLVDVGVPVCASQSIVGAMRVIVSLPVSRRLSFTVALPRGAFMPGERATADLLVDDRLVGRTSLVAADASTLTFMFPTWDRGLRALFSGRHLTVRLTAESALILPLDGLATAVDALVDCIGGSGL